MLKLSDKDTKIAFWNYIPYVTKAKWKDEKCLK